MQAIQRFPGCFLFSVWDFSNEDKMSLFVMVEQKNTNVWNQVCIVIQYCALQLLYHACVVISTYCYTNLKNQNLT